MKRSEINAIIKEAINFFEEYKIAFPDFVNWTVDDWKANYHVAQEIRDNMLGWDITDYGSGDFDKYGFSLITIRKIFQSTWHQKHQLHLEILNCSYILLFFHY